MRFELASNKTSCTISPPLTHQRLKHSQRTKINKTMLSAFPLHFFIQRSLYQNWKTNKYSILTVTELGLSVSESSTRITKFYTPIDSEHKVHKMEIKNGIWTVARPGTSSTDTSLRIHPRQTVGRLMNIYPTESNSTWQSSNRRVTRLDSDSNLTGQQHTNGIEINISLTHSSFMYRGVQNKSGCKTGLKSSQAIIMSVRPCPVLLKTSGML